MHGEIIVMEKCKGEEMEAGLQLKETDEFLGVILESKRI
jgi:hypothetical protein